MLIRQLAVALRNFQKNTVFTITNVLGLSLGMTAFVLILQYVSYEKSYNSFHRELSTLHRILNKKDNGQFDAYTAPGFAPMAINEITGIDDYCRIAEGRNLGTGVVSYVSPDIGADRTFRENDFGYADGNFFNFFTFPVVEGDARSLGKPNVVALSERTAQKYFGDISPLGKVLTLDNQFGKTLYNVEAVYKNTPGNSDLQYDLVFSIQTLTNEANLNGNEMWAAMDGTGSQWLYTYLKLKENADALAVSGSYSQLLKKVNPQETGMVTLQPLEYMHLGSSLSDPLPTFASLRFVYLLTGIALLILFIAWFNYVNLSTAGALKRAREVGIRKVVGASKVQLIRQFLGESVMLNATALLFSITLVGILQVPYASLVGKDLTMDLIYQGNFWVVGVLLLIAGTLATGFYTAFVLSSFNASHVLKGGFSKSIKGNLLRRSLVVMQFSVSLVLIAATIILYQQWRYMQTKDLGMNTSQLLIVRGAEVNRDQTFKERSAGFENDIQSESFVQAFCRSGNVPTDGFNFSTAGITKLSPTPGDEKVNYDILTIDNRYIQAYGIPLAAGSNFTLEMCDKSWNAMEYLILNERACELMGFVSPQDAVRQKVKWGDREFEVRGVMKDYHHLALQNAIGPIVFLPSRSGGYYSIRLSGGDYITHLQKLEKLYKNSFPGNPIEFSFLDDTFQSKYMAEKQYSIIFAIASGLAIFIGCLGLFGLATYTVEQRTKEIGIRKVLGSNVFQIVRLISTDFIRLVGIAFIIAVPVGWYAMDHWLNGFAYRVDIVWWVFATSGLVTLTVASITVFTQAIRGAAQNPVTSLRSE